MSGADVAELQRLLQPYGPGAVDGVYGPTTAAAVEQAKWTLGYPDDAVDEAAGPTFVGYLRGAETPPGYATRAAERRREHERSQRLRSRIVAVARWGIANAPRIHYRELRPIDALHELHRLPLSTDCSGFVTLCYCWAGAPDPNGNGYDGTGYTGTLLRTMRRIAQAAAEPGDLVVWGAFPGKHVALALETGADPLLASHGQERGPLAVPFSEESRHQVAPVVWLSLLR